MTWPRLPLQSHILHLSHPTVVSSILVGLHLSKAYFVLFMSMCLYLVRKYHFPSRLLLPPPALLSLYDLIYIQNFSKIPELLSLALNCLLGATPLFISAYYTCTLEHFTYTSSSTHYFSTFALPPLFHISFGVSSSQLAFNMETWVYLDSSLCHPNIQLHQVPQIIFFIISLKKFPTLQSYHYSLILDFHLFSTHLGFFLDFLCLWFSLLITASHSNFAIHPPNC